MKIRIDEDESGEFFVLFVGGNGEPWFRSTEGYTTRSNAVRSVNDFLAATALPETIRIYHFNAEGEQIDYA